MSSTHIILSPSLPALSLSLAQLTSLALEREIIIGFSLVGISSFAIRNGGRKRRIRKEEGRRRGRRRRGKDWDS